MSEDNESGEQGGQGRLLGILTAAGVGILVLVCVASMVLMIGVMAEVTALGDQLRKASKANKALQEEVAALREYVRPSAAAPAEPQQEAVNIDAADPANDCVIRSGEQGSGVAGCMGLDLKGKIK